MALLAEELVEEWLNRQGYFTLRGAKIGVHEMDLLAVRFYPDGDVEWRHVEVQVSVNPQSYLTRLGRADQRESGRAATSKAATAVVIEPCCFAIWAQYLAQATRRRAIFVRDILMRAARAHVFELGKFTRNAVFILDFSLRADHLPEFTERVVGP